MHIYICIYMYMWTCNIHIYIFHLYIDVLIQIHVCTYYQTYIGDYRSYFLESDICSGVSIQKWGGSNDQMINLSRGGTLRLEKR